MKRECRACKSGRPLLGWYCQSLPRRSSSHSIGNCALPSYNRTNFHQHASDGKQALKRMEQRGYWGVVVVVQGQKRNRREEARMWEEKQGEKINELISTWMWKGNGKSSEQGWTSLPLCGKVWSLSAGDSENCTVRHKTILFMSSHRLSSHCKCRQLTASKPGDRGERLSPSSKAGLCFC